MRTLSAILVLLLVSVAAQAGCPDWIKRFVPKALRGETYGPAHESPFYWNGKRLLTKNQVRDIYVWSDPFEYPYSPRFVKYSEDVFASFAIKTASLQKLIEPLLPNLPQDPDEAIQILNALNDYIGRDRNSTLTTFIEGVDHFRKEIKAAGGVRDWFELMPSSVASLNPERKEAAWSFALSALRETRGRNHVYIYTEFEPEWTKSGRTISVKLGDESFTGKLKSSKGRKSLVLDLPVRKVKNSAQNPNDEKHLQEMSAAGVKADHLFQGTLGQDGIYYIYDGGHRFRMLESDPKRIIQVELSWPIKTAPLQIWLNDIGAEQPTPEQFQKFDAGEINFQTFVGEMLFDRMLWTDQLPKFWTEQK